MLSALYLTENDGYIWPGGERFYVKFDVHGESEKTAKRTEQEMSI